MSLHNDVRHADHGGAPLHAPYEPGAAMVRENEIRDSEVAVKLPSG